MVCSTQHVPLQTPPPDTKYSRGVGKPLNYHHRMITIIPFFLLLHLNVIYCSRCWVGVGIFPDGGMFVVIHCRYHVVRNGIRDASRWVGFILKPALHSNCRDVDRSKILKCIFVFFLSIITFFPSRVSQKGGQNTIVYPFSLAVRILL